MAPRTDPDAPGTTTGRTRLPAGMGGQLAAVILGAVMPIMDSTIVAIGTPALMTAFSAGPTSIQWVSTAYVIALAIAVPVVGWAQRALGSRLLWTTALGAFTLGSALCALSPTIGVLIALRALQGLAAGILMTLMQSMPMQAARRAGVVNVGSLVATVSLPIAAGPILGPVLGGLVLHWLSWHWLFLINVPIGIAALLVAWRQLPADVDRAPQGAGPFDLVGFVLVGCGLASLLVGLTNTANDGGVLHRDVLVPAALAVLMLATFAVRSLRREDGRALLDLRLLTRRSVGSASLVVALAGGAMFSAQFLIPLYFQDLRGRTVLAAALLMTPQAIGSLLTRGLAGRLTDRVGSRVVALLASLLVALTTLPFVLLDASASDVALSALLFLRGLALGVMLIPVMLAAYTDAEDNQVPDASMLVRIFQQVGGALGTATVAVVLVGSSLGSGPAAPYRSAFLATVLVAALAALAACLLPGPRAPLPPAQLEAELSAIDDGPQR